MVLVMRTGRLRRWMPGERIDEDALRWDYSIYRFYFPNLLRVLLTFKFNVSISFVLLDYKWEKTLTQNMFESSISVVKVRYTSVFKFTQRMRALCYCLVHI
jgi:hypothetical protein